MWRRVRIWQRETEFLTPKLGPYPVTTTGAINVKIENSRTDRIAWRLCCHRDKFSGQAAGQIPQPGVDQRLLAEVRLDDNEDSKQRETPRITSTLADTWWTGPIAASSAETLSHGHVLFEPYLFDVRTAGSDYAGSQTYILYGATNRLTIGVIPTFGSAKTHGSDRPRRFGVGDLTLTTQYRLNRAKPGALLPTLALVVQRTLPLGRYDRLERNPDLGIGSGAQSTLVGLYAQRVDRLGNGRPLRTRLNVTYSLAPSIRLESTSVYGTPRDFRGSVLPGDIFGVDLSVEYSLSRAFVLASDVIYRSTARTSILADTGTGDDRRLATTRSLSIAPAFEYSWSASRGVLIGMRWTLKNDHVSPSITPVVAFNAVF